MNDDSSDPANAVIHLRVKQSLKNDWVRRSRTEGKRLQDWIVERVKQAESTRTKLDESSANES
jgi:hypothetical protein